MFFVNGNHIFCKNENGKFEIFFTKSFFLNTKLDSDTKGRSYFTPRLFLEANTIKYLFALI